MSPETHLTLLGPLPTPAATASPPPGPLAPQPGEPVLTALYDSTPLGLSTPGVRVQANMVSSVDGRLRGADGLSGSISSPADKRVFSVLRALADAVVVGAGTIRTERYTRLPAKAGYADARAARGQAPAPALVIVTNSGRLDIDRLTSAGAGPVVVHVGGAAQDSDVGELRAAFGADNVVVHTTQVTPAAVLHDCGRRGLTRLVHEGGPGLLGQWIAADCVDELCLTVSPYLQGTQATGAAPSLLDDTVLPRPIETTVRSVLTDGATLIYRLGLGPGR